ncbi:MAG: late competence development ComFB family protein [Oscillospiraceae bacterium]|jgi:competence protein ComFB
MLVEELTKNSQNDKVLFNVMEELVRRAVDERIEAMDMCKCEICRLNACALALNALPPRYVTSKRGNMLAYVSGEMTHFKSQVLVETTKALLQVKEHPLHDIR